MVTLTDAASAVTIAVKGGDGRYAIGNITLASAKSFAAPAVDLAGNRVRGMLCRRSEEAAIQHVVMPAAIIAEA